MNDKGFFLTLEGPDGCGKSTQARLLGEYLDEAGCQVLLTREPGGTPLAEEIRRVILTPSRESLDPMTEILLYVAARAQHVKGLILPALASGKVVICERFIDSSLAYQAYGLGWDLELIENLNRMAVGDLSPDLTLLFDQDTEECRKRVQGRAQNKGADRIEARDPAFHQKVREGFLKLAFNNPRFKVISGAGRDIESIQRELRSVLKTRIPKLACLNGTDSNIP